MGWRGSEYVGPLVRHHAARQEPYDTGLSDREIVDRLYPRSGNVQPSPRHWFDGGERARLKLAALKFVSLYEEPRDAA